MNANASPVPHPSAEEWEMLCVLAQESFAAAVWQGAAHASFHGFGITARRLSRAVPGRAVVELTLTACGSATPLDRLRIAVALRLGPGSACRVDFSHVPVMAACPKKFLAGCVSPIDARYASPETGQIS